MQITRSIVTHSGYAVLFDPGAVQLEGREVDLEVLQQNADRGAALVDRADAALALRYPDAVVELRLQPR